MDKSQAILIQRCGGGERHDSTQHGLAVRLKRKSRHPPCALPRGEHMNDTFGCMRHTRIVGNYPDSFETRNWVNQPALTCNQTDGTIARYHKSSSALERLGSIDICVD